MSRRVPCVQCGTPTTEGQTCGRCSTGLTHDDAEYRTNRAIVLANATRCGICWLPFQQGDARTVDHIVPLASGGTHAFSNLRAAHETCNKHKAAS